MYTHINDLTGKKCIVLHKEERLDLIKVGVTPTGYYVHVRDEDGSEHELFPWELTEIVLNGKLSC